MVRSRVLWILWLIATGICYVAAENAAFLLLAGVSLALPLLAAVPARQAGKELLRSFLWRHSGKKEERHPGKSSYRMTACSGRPPALSGLCENLLTGERNTAPSNGGSGPDAGREDFGIRCRHCGRVRVSAASAYSV